MSHHIYNTEGFVLSSNASQEASKVLCVFTKELGVVNAIAQGVRLLKSKLRYSLQDFSYTNISLIRGKEIWRVTSASPVATRFPLIQSHSEYYIVYIKILSLLKRLLNGEEKNESLFISVTEAFDFLENTTLSSSELLSFECILVLKILHNLGYGAKNQVLDKYASPLTWDKDKLGDFDQYRVQALTTINTALRESQL